LFIALLQSMRMKQPRSIARLTLLSGLAIAFIGFVALGVWQIERLAWKRDLIQRVESRINAPATEAPRPEAWREIATARDEKRYEYMRVEVSGRYLSGADTRVQAVTAIGAGYWLLTPLQRADGSIVLINRGFVSPEWMPSAARESAAMPEIRVTGLLRLSEGGGAFLRSNSPADGRWYSRDVHAIAAAHGLQRVAPYFIDADAADDEGADIGSDRSGVSEPVGGLTVVRFRNHHLQYALTWFVLALMVVAAVWRVLREDRR
jgi:surfeit locus 1 family protein